MGILNRGEAAVRFLNAAAEFGREEGLRIETVAFYTDPDRNAAFVREADHSVHLSSSDPGVTARQAYLSLPLLEQALTASRVDAVWPGWGFVSENPEFVRLCDRLAITFIGPPADSMAVLGDKMSAKLLAESEGVPVARWSRGPVDSLDAAVRQAERIGYPVVLKAAAGGGGRGIRVATSVAELRRRYDESRREAASAFGDDRVFIEAVVAGGRHIEVQIAADRAGTVWALGLRDCSVQRRRQKVLEESRPPDLLPVVEAALLQAATRLCRAAGYRSLGTVEFLLDPKADSFVFMEVNTRLQVEHAVTELVYGADLVKMQLAIARGAELHGAPRESAGHAIEARLNAEDPSRNFVASPGKVLELRLPHGPGIRVDTGVTAGDEIPSEFDSMIAKILAVGRTREEALSRLARALESTQVIVEGGATNRSLLLFLVGHPDLIEGGVDITWLDREVESGAFADGPDSAAALVLAAIEQYQADEDAAIAAFSAGSPNRRVRVDLARFRKYELSYQGGDYVVEVRQVARGRFLAAVDGEEFRVHAQRHGLYQRHIEIGATRRSGLVWFAGGAAIVEIGRHLYRVGLGEQGIVRAASGSVVVAIRVAEGDRVEAGQVLVTTEAMKMEAPLLAPFGGTVREVMIGVGQHVDAGEVLLRLDRDAGPTGDVSGPRIDFHDQSGNLSEFAPSVWEDIKCAALGYDSGKSMSEMLSELTAGGWRASPSGTDVVRTLNILTLLADQMLLLQDSEPWPEGRGQHHNWAPLLRLVASPSDALNNPSDPPSDRLRRVLGHYDIPETMEPEAVVNALYYVARSQCRLDDLARLAGSVLETWLHHPPAIGNSEQVLDIVLDRLVQAGEGSFPYVADLARAVRHQIIKQPALDLRRGQIVRSARSVLAGPKAADGAARASLIDLDDAVQAELVTQAGGSSHRSATAALEVLVRRFHRQRSLGVAKTREDTQLPAVQLAVSSGPSPSGVLAVAGTAADARIVDAITSGMSSATWKSAWAEVVLTGTPGDAEAEELLHQVAAEVTDELDLTTTVTWRHTDGSLRHSTAFCRGGAISSANGCGGLHPSVAERLELWRLAGFRLASMAAPDGIHLLRAEARTNPADERLFALLELFDPPPSVAPGQTVEYPALQDALAETAIALRRARSQLRDPARALNNRIVVHISPLWSVEPSQLKDLFTQLAPSMRGLGIERILLRVRRPLPLRDQPVEDVIHISPPRDPGLMIGRASPSASPIRPLSAYKQRVVELARRGLTHPYEIVTMLISPGASHSDFPPGTFEEHDLDDAGALRPVDRAAGRNEAGVIVGVIENQASGSIERLRRVLILNDPSDDLGSLAEPECRRIIAALDLADELGVPVDWFAVSSGALIAMDSGTENLDWTAMVLRRVVTFTQGRGTINVVVAGINVGAQSYFDAEATMLMHTKGLLVMVGPHAMVLTGKQALEFSGSVSADDNESIGGYKRISGPNGQAQQWAPDLPAACALLFRHHAATATPLRRAPSTDPRDRDIRSYPHCHPGSPFRTVGEIFSPEVNPERRLPFDIRTVMAAIADQDCTPLERWPDWNDARNVVIQDVRLGGRAVLMAGIESHPLERTGAAPHDGPETWLAGTLFPQSSKKLARALNAASSNRPAIILANLSGFDGSPESMRELQLEYGAEIARAVVNFEGPLTFCVLTRCHGGAFVVFSQALNRELEIIALQGSRASVLGGVPAAAVVFGREVSKRVRSDPRWRQMMAELNAAPTDRTAEIQAELGKLEWRLTLEMRAVVASEFDKIHTVERALEVGSVNRIVSAAELRPQLIRSIERLPSGAGRL